ncbi:acyltransferase family protein [Zoogloea sp. LCSB751]|uniref:acyltransferase family protein n=1 Tax=Zoogloea sp. LCSB751 TaxID=1965277 RepID=UPI0011170ED7|nr:acyltransferase family protein [Zoogloea sp. LCSB751]
MNHGGRLVGIDVARGLLMAYVVCVIHPVFWFRLVPQEVGSILLFEMPLIFMISGAAYRLSERAKPAIVGFKGYCKWVLRRGIRILVPYWAYALVCTVLVLKYGGSENCLDVLVAWLNPTQYGEGSSILMLNWHLWFVAPFLAVSILLPAIIFFVPIKKPPLWLLALLATAFVYIFDILDTTKSGWLQTIFFYLVWTVFGFSLTSKPTLFGSRCYLKLFAMSFIVLSVLFIFKQPGITLNMQANKFPPNAIFFIFSCAWVSIILLFVGRLASSYSIFLVNSILLKPFIYAGYSIYLWQGLGYSIAQWLGMKFDLNVAIVTACAISLSIVLGLVASPIERLRLR